jgi:hypothetical protein
VARDDKADRKAKLRAWREGEHAKAHAEFPLPDAQLDAFFEGVEVLREQHGCFHDCRHSTAVLASMGLSGDTAERVFEWCEDHGGYCDCEIAGNTHQHWEQCRART